MTSFLSAGISYGVGTDLLDALARILVLIFVLSVHEWAHAYAAYRCGDPTAKNLGRMTLNPIKHLDPIGFVMMLVCSVGYAKPVPVNEFNFRHPKRDRVFVSLAGILANFIIAVIFLFVTTAIGTLAPGFWYSDSLYVFFLRDFLDYFVVIDIGLMVFNLLPIFPLDGFHVVEAHTRSNNRYRTFMYRYGQMILLGLLLESVLMDVLFRTTGIGVFAYLDLLGNLMQFLSKWIIWPLQWVFNAFWGVFV